METGIHEPSATPSANGASVNGTSGRQTRRRLEIATKAAQVFATSGYHTVGMRDVAAAVGIKGASLYNHFSSKEEILYEIALSVTRDTVEGYISILDAPGRAVDRLAALIRAQISYVAVRRTEHLVTLAELKALTDEHRRNVLDYRTYYQRRVRDMIIAGHRAGDFHTLNPGLATTALMDMLNGISGWYRPDMDVDLLADDYIRLGIGGLLGYQGDVEEVCRIAVELIQKSGVQVLKVEPATG
ncbi:TetR/AcrR family transcriptional regulator [Rhodococcus sp. NPDC127530]|uniref:TetR/AcrR family transcriptional regulator n=1 Tax=unclassified Rhodococcus (in: high G+C Gram-positive bacteria) TaxID=192944 RepID=UPI003637670A